MTVKRSKGQVIRASMAVFLWLYWFVLLGLGVRYLFSGDAFSSATSSVFSVLALAGQMGSFALVVGVLPFALSFWGRSLRAAQILFALLASFLLCFLMVDAKLYELYRFHFNAFALNVIFTPGGFATMGISHGDLLLGATVPLVVFAMCYGVLVGTGRLLSSASKAPPLGVALLAAILAFMAAERAVFAWGDYRDDPEITKNVGLLPFYEPFQIRGNLVALFGDPAGHAAGPAAGELGFDGDVLESSLNKSQGSSRLNYPDKDFRFAIGKPYNVVMVAIESVRSDLLTPEVMPNLFRLSQRSQVFRAHHSGGNATRFGIFSLAYGLDGLYWKDFLSERRGPLFFSALRHANYEIRSWTSVPVDYPEFRQTVFVNDLETLDDRQDGEFPWQRDDAVRAKFVRYLEERSQRASRAPFFTFVFLDGPHAPYSYPENQEVFSAEGQKVESYFEILDRKNAVQSFVRYKNAVHYADRNLGLMFDALERLGELENTLIYVTGDHGQEFWEYGYYGHNGAFNPMQVVVPSVLFVPHLEPAAYDHWTEHQDVVPTLLELLQADGDPYAYSSGQNLLDAKARDHMVTCSFSECALRDSEGWVVFGTQEKKSFKLDYFDANYRPVSRAVGATPGRLAALREFFEGRKFLKNSPAAAH